MKNSQRTVTIHPSSQKKLTNNGVVTQKGRDEKQNKRTTATRNVVITQQVRAENEMKS